MNQDKKVPRYITIIKDLTEEITTGKWQPGDKLPSEAQLMIRYQVSRIVAVNALNALAQQGLIVRRHGKGSFVKERTPFSPGPLGEDSAIGGQHISLITQGFGNHFSTSMFMAVHQQALKKNLFCSHYVSYIPGQDVAPVEEELLRHVQQIPTKGILLFPAHQHVYNNELLRLASSDFPIVLLDRELTGLGFPCVQSDHRKMGEMAAHHCIAKGHTKIAYFRNIEQVLPAVQRQEGFESVMREVGLPFGGDYCVNLTEKESTKIMACAEALIKQGVTAFVAAPHYLKPLSLLLQEKQLPIPYILSIDKPEPNLFCFPPPDYILQDTEAIGCAAVELLCRQMQSTKRQYERILISPQLIESQK